MLITSAAAAVVTVIILVSDSAERFDPNSVFTASPTRVSLTRSAAVSSERCWSYIWKTCVPNRALSSVAVCITTFAVALYWGVLRNEFTSEAASATTAKPMMIHLRSLRTRSTCERSRSLERSSEWTSSVENELILPLSPLDGWHICSYYSP